MTPHAAKDSRPRVLLTRSEEDCAEWAARFARLGMESESLPCIHCEPIATEASKAALAAAVPRADWLVFTSRRGVEAFSTLYDGSLGNARVATVGAATGESARERLGRVVLIGRGGAA